MTPLYNQACTLQRDGRFRDAIDTFERALRESISAIDRMVIKYGLAICVWESADLEMDGKVHSLGVQGLAAAETAQKLWEDVVNIYHDEVEGEADELAGWPFRHGSPHQMCKDAVAASTRAYSAIDRVKRGR